MHYDYLTGYDHLQFIGDMQGISKKQIMETAERIGNEGYLNIPKIANGEISALVNNPGINIQTGSLVLLASTLLPFVMGYFLLGLKNKVRK